MVEVQKRRKIGGVVTSMCLNENASTAHFHEVQDFSRRDVGLL